MSELNIVEAIRDAMDTALDTDDDVLLLGEDIGVDGGVFRATDGLIDEYGEDRVIDTPLSESGIVGSSIGLAVRGFKPVAEIQFSGFMYPAFDQLISHASRIRNRSRGAYTCPLVVRAPYGGGIQAPEHHSESMEAIYGHTPGLKVVIPSTPSDAKGLLLSAIRDPDPVVFLEPKQIYRAFKEEVPDGEHTVEIGEANVVEDGDDVTVIAWGAMMQPTLDAVENVDADVEVIDLRTISPLDLETLYDSIEKTGRLVIVHEAPKSFGPAAEISATINEHDLLYLEAPIRRVTGFDTIFPLYKLEGEYLPDENRIEQAITEVVEF